MGGSIKSLYFFFEYCIVTLSYLIYICTVFFINYSTFLYVVKNKYAIYKSIDKQANKVRQGHLIIYTSVFTFAS